MRYWRKTPLLRIAIHPHDIDHPATIRSIQNVVTSLLPERQSIPYEILSNGWI
jgi:hypothetical protein